MSTGGSAHLGGADLLRGILKCVPQGVVVILLVVVRAVVVVIVALVGQVLGNDKGAWSAAGGMSRGSTVPGAGCVGLVAYRF